MIDRYTREEMRELWSDRTRYQIWLDVELAACRAMEKQGDVPVGTAEAVAAKVTIDPARVLEIEKRTQHDVIAFLTHLEQQAGESARWLHLGMTSSDVLDTSFAIQLRRAGELILADLDLLLAALEQRAHELKKTPMVGRSHGIHAEPTSVGLVFAGYHAEMSRNRARLVRALESIAVGKIAGAVGVYGNLAPAIEREALGELGIVPETCATQVVQRDRHAELFNALGLIAATLERIAIQVRHWQRTEVAEAREPFGSGQKGSSAMPHKRNPILSENVSGLARLVKGYARDALDNIALWHERDISHSSVERVIAPDATTLVDFMLARMTRVVSGLVIDAERMAHNLARTGGLIFSEAVLLALVRKGMGRQRAYERVQAQALASMESPSSFRELLGGDSEISARMTAAELDQCFDLAHHLRHVDVIYRRVFGE